MTALDELELAPALMPASLSASRIAKSFGGVHALVDGDLEVRPGEIHALMGENGSGKSTLIGMLAGRRTPDRGVIRMGGNEVVIGSPRDANALGVGLVSQDLQLVLEFTVAENLFVGAWPTGATGVERRQMRQMAREVLARFGLDSSVDTPVRLLSPDQRQIVEIARALLRRPRLLLLDEPTASLTPVQVDTLFGVLTALRGQGVSSLLVSHRLREVYDICDRATVLRDGKTIGTVDLPDCPEDELIRMMVGRPLEKLYEKAEVTPGPVALEVAGLSRGLLSDIDLTVHQGEIVGLAGLSGAGRSALARTLFGTRRPETGVISVMGEPVQFHSPQDAIAAGLALIPENRAEQGLVLSASVRENAMMAALKDIKPWSVLSAKKQRERTARYVEELRIRTSSVDAPVSTLSGGNQQKVVLAKWLAVAPKAFIFDEPTQGIDIGAKADIYRLLARLVEEGCAVLLISSDLPELLAVSDRIYTMHHGRIVGCLDRSEATEENVAAGMVGGRERER